MRNNGSSVFTHNLIILNFAYADALQALGTWVQNFSKQSTFAQQDLEIRLD